MTTTHSILETVLSLGGVAALLAPAVVLMERTHRRAERAAGRRATRTTARDDADARRVADAVHLADGWLSREMSAGRCALPLNETAGHVVFHGHCHQKALVGVGGSAAALRAVPGSRVDVLDAGCCGMAGSFGYEKDHYDISVKIAGLALLPALKAAPDAHVAATGTSCRHQIRDLTGREARHPIEMLAAAAGV